MVFLQRLCLSKVLFLNAQSCYDQLPINLISCDMFHQLFVFSKAYLQLFVTPVPTFILDV